MEARAPALGSHRSTPALTRYILFTQLPVFLTVTLYEFGAACFYYAAMGNPIKGRNMSKPLPKFFTSLTVRKALLCSLAAGSLLAGCVATVRVPGPPPPPPPPRVYSPPPPPPAAAAPVEVEVQATEAPPPLPDYDQPPCPEDGWLWTPGYWAYSTGGYYWIPGTWVAPPQVGVLWTPGYWGFVGGVYLFHAGYWGPHIGFYGGVNYGFGYGGVGFAGGRWVGNSFAYNTAVVHVNTTVIHNTYVNNVTVNNITVNKVSYNGGAGGIAAAPTPQERAAMSETHVASTPAQRQHVNEAVRNPQLAAKANGGHPPIAATARPAAFNGPGVVGAEGMPPRTRHPMPRRPELTRRPPQLTRRRPRLMRKPRLPKRRRRRLLRRRSRKLRLKRGRARSPEAE